MSRRRISQQQVDYIIKNFANMTRTELMAGAGVSKSTVDHIQVRYNLHKSPEHIHNMGVKA